MLSIKSVSGQILVSKTLGLAYLPGLNQEDIISVCRHPLGTIFDSLIPIGQTLERAS